MEKVILQLASAFSAENAFPYRQGDIVKNLFTDTAGHIRIAALLGKGTGQDIVTGG